MDKPEDLFAQGTYPSSPISCDKHFLGMGLRVDDITGLAGFVIPGKLVDVLISETPPNSSNATGTMPTILEDITILAVGQNYAKDSRGKVEVVNVTNIMTTSKQADIITLATRYHRARLDRRRPARTKPGMR
jgi:pilus assembly protein CpaB